MNNQPIDPIYLPFSTEQLRGHFAPTATRSADEQAARHLGYYLASAERYHSFQADHPDRPGLSLSKSRTPCQIEKDERFWVVTCLMSYYHSAGRTEHLNALMRLCYGDTPPLAGIASWDECLGGKLHLFFEVSLPSPPGYKRWLAEHLDQRQIIPYVLDAGRRPGTDEVRGGLEGATHVDAMLLSADNGFGVLFEAKVLSDVSCQVSFDAMRNQIARNIDVMLERNDDLPEPLNRRRPERTLFALLTPEIFRRHPHSRLCGWLMNEYRSDPTALARDIPHRKSVDWLEVSRRIGGLTWEECERILPGSCPWLVRERVSQKQIQKEANTSPAGHSPKDARTQEIKPRGMIYKYCQCGHPIGLEMAADAPLFFDNYDWDKPVDTCPSCHERIRTGGLEFSAEQSARLHDIYQMLRKWARERDKRTT